jgi:hypothetical protein
VQLIFHPEFPDHEDRPEAPSETLQTRSPVRFPAERLPRRSNTVRRTRVPKSFETLEDDIFCVIL